MLYKHGVKLENWKTQLRKGILEFHLMSLLEPQERYGADILQALCLLELHITDGTLYALLGRMSREKLIVGRWRTENALGHPRKYYTLTPEGRSLLSEMKQEWNHLIKRTKKLLEANHE